MPQGHNTVNGTEPRGLTDSIEEIVDRLHRRFVSDSGGHEPRYEWSVLDDLPVSQRWVHSLEGTHRFRDQEAAENGNPPTDSFNLGDLLRAKDGSYRFTDEEIRSGEAERIIRSLPVMTVGRSREIDQERAQQFRVKSAVNTELARIEARRIIAASSASSLDIASEVLGWDDLATIPPARPLFGRIIFEEQLAEIVGAPGDGKTFFTLGMACAVAAGHSWAGFTVQAPAPVLYVLAEGTSGVPARVRAWAHRNKVDTSELRRNWHTLTRPAQLGVEQHVENVRDFVARREIKLVVFDTRARSTVGMEENSATDQGLAIAHTDIIRRAGAAVVTVHHTAKGAAAGGGGRGSGAWNGAVDTSLHVQTRRNRDHVPVLDDKGRQQVTVTVDKLKDGATGTVHDMLLEPFTVPEELLPLARGEEDRSTVVMVRADPFSTADDAEGQLIESKHTTAKGVLEILRSRGGDDGMPRAALLDVCTEVTGKTGNRNEYLVGSKSSVNTSIWYLLANDLALEIGTRREKVLVCAPPDGQAVDSAYAPGTPRYAAKVREIDGLLRRLTDDGRITDTVTGRTNVETLLGTSVPVAAFTEAWGQWENAGRPGTHPG